LNILSAVKKIWNDSVWSKVIATVISAGLLGALAWIGGHFGVWFARWPVPGWLLGLFVLVIVSLAALLYRNHKAKGTLKRTLDQVEWFKREVTRLKEELKTEQNSLQDCPQVVIKLREDSGGRKYVVVHNASPNIDAFDIEMDPVDGQDLKLVAERVPHLEPGGAGRLELSAERVKKRASLPSLPARSEARAFFEEAADGKPFSSAKVHIHYRNVTSTKRCGSTAEILWYVSPESTLANVTFGTAFRE
jgi:hypothetical protein